MTKYNLSGIMKHEEDDFDFDYRVDVEWECLC